MIKLSHYVVSALLVALAVPAQPAFAIQVDAQPDPVVVSGSTFYIRDTLTTGSPTTSFSYGSPNDYPVFGDWNGDGVATVGVVHGNVWSLRNSNSAGAPSITFAYGLPGDTPVVGDWDGDGDTTPGVVRGNTWYLRNSNTNGGANLTFSYGMRSDRVVTGDWDGDGDTNPGVVRGNVWYLRNYNSTGGSSRYFAYGLATDRPIVGDWDGDGDTNPGMIRGNLWLLRNYNSNGLSSRSFRYGSACDVALSSTMALARDRGGKSPKSSMLGRDVNVLPTTSKVVALTFDAGANAAGLSSILNTLNDYCVPATFFLTGSWTRSFPDQARAIGLRYPVGNHTDTHPHLPALSDSAVRAQVLNAQAAIMAGTRYDPRPVFRFPYGDRSTRTLSLVNSLGYVSIRWTVDTLGWKGTSGGQSASTVVQRVINTLRPGQIVLMHVGSNPDDGSTLDAAALPTLITELRSRGYSFVTVQQYM
ncbi:MAG TPA: polysaccharide deacetylase family protein [Micromonosporaceae bacterium]